MKPAIYIACPYGSGRLTKEENVANAGILTRYAALIGENPFSPVNNFVVLEPLVEKGQVTEREILELCLLTLRGFCEAILLAPNYFESTGARIELLYAEARGYRVETPSIEDIKEVTGEDYNCVPW